jgi:hypothetical protein
MKEGYVVRRGAPFTFEISTSEPLAEGQEIKIDIQGDDNRRPPYQAKFIGLAANDEYVTPLFSYSQAQCLQANVNAAALILLPGHHGKKTWYLGMSLTQEPLRGGDPHAQQRRDWALR